LRFVRQSITPRARSATEPTTTPTAIPAIAPVDDPLLLDSGVLVALGGFVMLAIVGSDLEEIGPDDGFVSVVCNA
jgi:hypothetical protein